MIRSIIKRYFQGIVHFWCNSYKIILPLSRILNKMHVTHLFKKFSTFNERQLGRYWAQQHVSIIMDHMEAQGKNVEWVKMIQAMVQ